jgi:hypothetical protein
LSVLWAHDRYAQQSATTGEIMANDDDELQRLEREVRATARARIDLEDRLADPGALRSATARAYRDRDAVTNPLLEEARAKVAADIAALTEQWREVDTVSRNAERLDDLLDEAPDHIRGHRDAIMAALPAAREARARVGRDLAEAGLQSLLPQEGWADDEG